VGEPVVVNRTAWSNDLMLARLRCLPLWLLCLFASVAAQSSTLPPATQISDGVQLYRLDDVSLLAPAGPVAVQALRLDPRKVTLEIGRATGEPSRETVDVIAGRRDGTIAAINAGFFSLETGRPVAFLKVDGTVVSGTTRPRGAVGILHQGDTTTLLFDRLSVATQDRESPLFNPLLGSSRRDWQRVPHAISGAGLLLLDGRELKDWTDEKISAGFDTTRHPRTLIGTDGQGAIWLITVDGRQPTLSLGMSFDELKRLARRLGLRSVLNLDGGGSTTMWVRGQIVNHPSDPGGPRKVSDAILVVPRKP
jgi:exopolysaccharide biosynthesis protein